MNNDIVTCDPVDWRSDTIRVTSLERVDYAQNLCSVAPGRCRVRQDCADRLLRVDDEDGADRECNSFAVDIGCILVVKPGSVSTN